MNVNDSRGIIFNIQRYSIHDGPGIRTTVFIKGCPLRCLWCQNPESHLSRPIVFLNSERCTGCGTCLQACPRNAISLIEGASKTDRNRCNGTGNCASSCPNQARTLIGRSVTAHEVFSEVNADAIFYETSAGGVTLSGGEPLSQPDFAISILKQCKQAGIHTAIETCGYAEWNTLRRVLEYTDLVLYDIKHMNPEAHKEYTGVSNHLILDNIKKVCAVMKLPVFARIPIIPQYNDSERNVLETAEFIACHLGKSVSVHLLPYHRFGEAKYQRMEAPAQSVRIIPPDDAHMERIADVIRSFGLQVFMS